MNAMEFCFISYSYSLVQNISRPPLKVQKPCGFLSAAQTGTEEKKASSEHGNLTRCVFSMERGEIAASESHL